MISTGDLKAGLWTAFVVLLMAMFVFVALEFTIIFIIFLKVLLVLLALVFVWIIFMFFKTFT